MMPARPMHHRRSSVANRRDAVPRFARCALVIRNLEVVAPVVFLAVILKTRVLELW